MKDFTIGPNDTGQRLDKFLRKAVPALPVSLMYKYIRLKKIKKNRKRCEISEKLCEGDLIELYIEDEFFTSPQIPFLSAPSQLTVVYEDKNILLIDKPAGLLVHEDKNEKTDTLINRIQHYLYKKGEYLPEYEHSFAPALCNRIDRNTGGIVIAAKNFNALQIISEKIKNREISKYYLCIVHGIIEKKSGLLKGYHIKDERAGVVHIYQTQLPGTKTALTKYRVLSEKDDLSLVEIDLLTGRTHQIRAHMASIGHPLLGDGRYGKSRKTANERYQALYSYKLTFRFPTDAGILNYLKGHTFQVAHVPFAEQFI